MLACPTCHKKLPHGVRFCAYCGATIARPSAWRAWLDAVVLPTAGRPAVLLGGLGALLGALIGGLLGQLLGDPAQGDYLLGGVVGAAGVGVAAAWGEGMAARQLDRETARRFGQVFGGLGGGLALLGGLLVAALIFWQAGRPAGWQAALASLADHAPSGLRAALLGGFLGTVTGILAGRFAARVGYDLLQRRGAILGAALAWTLGGIVGGLFAGESAARLAGGDPVAGSLLGMVVQVALGAVVLTQVQRFVRGWRAWRRPRP